MTVLQRALSAIGLSKREARIDPEVSFAQKCEQAKLDALRAGGGVLYPHSNVAYGTFGYGLSACEFDGLMAVATTIERYGPIETGLVSRYTLTEAGRQAAAMLSEDHDPRP